MTVQVTDLQAIGHGIQRPEHVLVSAEGHVYASDKSSAVAEILGNDYIRRIGDAGGEPNGFAVDRRGHFLIANFGAGVLQDLDPETGAIVEVLRDKVHGRSLQWLNFVLVDRAGALWCSVSTTADDLMDTIARGVTDGYIFRVAADRSSVDIVAEEVNFPNCMALDHDEQYLYVARTVAADAVRFPVKGGSLGEQERFGPALGARRADEFGPHAAALLADPNTCRRWAMADGCALDADGNLWVTLVFANRIVAISPEGNVEVVVEDPDGVLLNAPTSIAWGGEDMRNVYIGSMSTPYVLKGRSSVPGMPMIHQR
ncbi:SMP-30/gluconolactonase/LRE family protein [Mycobacterium avium]|uniref:SMP-30/gluconolactonase/LRE family protein n=1 Tax=Mycobacterium avium TaxID=1764 RepID=UPI0007C727D4|nr:SMP-30/gluconolactonase/LRE family protein [Mycobacterium avium]MDV3290053.1 SMP-30/gluconolactonase/LRE family protein [Mycobacterium avium subsp. hominissuis]